MTVDAPVTLESFFRAPEFDAQHIDAYADLAFGSARSRESFEALTRAYRADVERGQGDAFRLATAYYILGNYQEALDWYKKAGDTKQRRFLAAKAAAALCRFEQAEADFTKASEKGWDAFACDMQIAMVRLRTGNADGAEKLLRKHERAGSERADWHYVSGLLAEVRDERDAALERYEKALSLDRAHVEAAFRAARLCDLRGDDERAIHLYEQVAHEPRAHVNALINLSIVYEDIGRYDAALDCLRRVLAAFPNHARARLFLKDVESSRLMMQDEARQAKGDARSRLLETTIAEFELSVRARNCLKKMRIQTLGDLLKLTEAELLAYKNFGETSLNEIKALLAKKGLRLGQRPEEIDPSAIVETPPPRPPVPPGAEAILSRPVSELEFSVRARRCLQRLNISTIADLIQHSEQDLLSTRNFGVTSLSEIKARLADLGLQLAPKS
ncbi:MAG: tetratricopeptide repeat protein [Phycisphaerae bacterium]|nr:tetratricopeptide repeat protein [Phycisphaerae bacterium]MCZ2399460.1 tetratricopeptide repeat protein [Phycisphaerae bacterium]NUQ50510.1 tetratricopeptide repeat protein [Phycisphaerae bacterium]